MIIEHWENPKTESYEHLKNLVLNPGFSWTYGPSTNPDANPDDSICTENPVYQHCVLAGADVSPDFLIPQVHSRHADLVFHVIKEILDFNKVEYLQIHRCVINQIHYWDGKPSPPHVDHPSFEHKNCLIYLNQFDRGNINIYDNMTRDCKLLETYKPDEDDIISFPGYHHSVDQPAPMQRRVVVVFTYS